MLYPAELRAPRRPAGSSFKFEVSRPKNLPGLGWRHRRSGISLVRVSSRLRPLWYSLAGLVLAWILAMAGFAIVRHNKATPEKIWALLQSTDLSKLSPEDRKRALARLADLLNRLTPEDRRKARISGEWGRWMKQMTTGEKTELIEKTLPSGINQMLSAFEQMPDAQRRKVIGESIQQMRQARAEAEAEGTEGSPGPAAGEGGGDPFADLPQDTREKIVAGGLKSFMDQGSADTKAQLQPLIEELQRSMENGGRMGRRRPLRPSQP